MGLVYRAYDLRFSRLVALKAIAAELAFDREFRRRFESEIELAAQIEHPHVVPVYDRGEAPDGQLFVVMRFIDGTDLAQLLARRGRLDPSYAARLVAQIASALDAAHARGLVHRDIKPANVLLSESDDAHAYLTDFGVAKRLSPGSGRGLTRHGMMVGTVAYMAPEQAEGLPVDRRADIYALGTVLYEVITGRLPYDAETDASILLAKLSGPPPPPSQLASDLPEAFDSVLARALARAPADRFGSAGELARATLDAAAAGVPATTVAEREIGPGAVLADCVIHDVLGEGGMAVVYRATQLKLGRQVALKVMTDELAADPSFRARFAREWRLAASIDHPNVIPIYWAGEEQGFLYVVMRLVVGSNLREIVRERGPIMPERAVTVIEQLASALDAAHEHGLLHRDVKPANVLIDEETGHVYLTDFGLAKGRDDGEELTGSGEVLGTARYIAPERSRGLGDEDERADVYSLGCLLWDMLGGIERPDLADVPNVPSELARVVRDAIALDPRDRFESAGTMAAAARRALQPLGDGGARVSTVTGGDSASIAPGPFAPPEPFAPPPLTRGLAARVLALCESTLEHLPSEGNAHEGVTAIVRELTKPLRVTLFGADGSGRSMLANALGGRPVELAVLSSESAASIHSDATAVVHPADLGAIDSDQLLSVVSGLGLTPINGVVLVSKSDLLGDAERATLVSELRRALQPRVTVVIPCSGLLAKAADGLTDADTSAMERIAALEPPVIEELLDDRDNFISERSPLSPEERQRLLEVTGLYGVRLGVQLADAGQLSTPALARRFREASGIEDVGRELQRFELRADALKADRALDRLEHLAYTEPELATLRDDVDELRHASQMHLLDLSRAYERCLSDSIQLPADRLEELRQLLTGRSVAERLGASEGSETEELKVAAHQRVHDWKILEGRSQASARIRRLARAAGRSYELIATRELVSASPK